MASMYSSKATATSPRRQYFIASMSCLAPLGDSDALIVNTLMQLQCMQKRIPLPLAIIKSTISLGFGIGKVTIVIIRLIQRTVVIQLVWRTTTIYKWAVSGSRVNETSIHILMKSYLET